MGHKYTLIWFLKIICKKALHFWICGKKIFLWEKKWSKHQYIDSYVLERNWGCHLRITLVKTLEKGELWRKMEDDCSTPPFLRKPHPPSFLPSPPPLNQETVQAPPPPFLGILPPSILVFREYPLKSQIFKWAPKILKFFTLNTILSFKSN